MKIKTDDQFFIGRGRYHPSLTMSSSFQTYAESLNVSSALVRYFGSGKFRSATVQQYSSSSSGNSSFGSRGRFSVSPLSSIENLEITPLMSLLVFGMPGKVDEEVLVMDDILVRLASAGKSGRSSSSSSSGGSSGKRACSRLGFALHGRNLETAATAPNARLIRATSNGSDFSFLII